MYEFTFKPFEEMTEADYAAVGFKSGLEVHQQLLTGQKLFCRCPAGKYNKSYHAEILRNMRPTLSELGEYDGTALMEFKTKKEIVYRINYDTVCTYEMDDTPPFELNEEALDIALGIAQMYACNMVDEIHIARKQYLDGSIPTGFQRTTIVGVNGRIPYKEREIGVIQLGLEEDSCREVSDVGHYRTYITDRLGMPLIETVTGADMRTPREVAEVGEIIRRMARATGRVRTGIGAARQDVNVSVTGGTRIEIKGVSHIPNIPLLTYNEAMRQWNLLRLREELRRRGITPESFSSKICTITKLVRKTRFKPIREAIQADWPVKAVVLKGFKGLLHWETQTDTFFSEEISDRVRVIACLTTLPNIIHSDSPSESLSSFEWREIKKHTGAAADDTVVLVWGPAEDAEMGAGEIAIRAKEAAIGVPSETRQAQYDGTNGFERILPGPSRMYPDTDLPPKKITRERLGRIRETLPEFFWEREAWYRTLGIPADVIRPLAISRFAPLFEFLVKEWEISPVLASVALIQYAKRLRRWRLDPDLLAEEMIRDIFRAYREGLMSREAILYAMRRAIEDGFFRIENLPPRCTKEELIETMHDAHEELYLIDLRDEANKPTLLMGSIMRRLRGRVDAETVASLVNTIDEEV